MYESFEARFKAAEKRERLSIPKGSISWIVSRLHVSTSDAEVEADIRQRTEKLYTPAQINKCVKYALKCHRENQGLYDFVMRGH